MPLLLKPDGKNDFEAIDNIYIPYPPEFKVSLRELFIYVVPFLDLEKRLTDFHIEVTKKLLKKAKLEPKHIRALGGQGAPLVPVFHKLLMKEQEKPSVVVNIGRIANLTYISEENFIAFDTGPGNALIDDAMIKYFGLPYDDSGKIASQGNVDNTIVNKVLSNEYFSLKYPKSLDRNTFKFLKDVLAKHSPTDIIATLTYISSVAIAHSIFTLPDIPKKILICRGGTKNTQMLLWLEKNLTSQRILSKVENISKISNSDPDYIESQAFAYFSARFFNKLPSAFPSTTGAISQNICGCLVKAYS